MNKGKLWVAKTFFRDFLVDTTPSANEYTQDASSSKSRDLAAGLVKRIGFRSGDIASKEFQEPEFDLTQITNGYSTDSYIRQGIDKYIDQIFKEGYDFFGKDTAIVDYIKLRLNFIAEATGTPTGQFLVDMAEDVVKYANCIVAKARATDVNSLPPTVKVTGLNGAQPIAGYFCINVTNMKVKRDKFGTILGWQQEVEGGDKPIKFKPEDIVHIYYKKEKGNAFGTSFLAPVLDDVRALRQAEENILRMMYRNIYPFYHVAVGDKEAPGTPNEVADLQNTINTMDIEGGIVTTSRVVIKPVASDQVINAEPYLKYLEERVFSGLGVPAIMFGRGNTANRSTGDNMTSEMADRIKAIQKTIEMFINTFIVKELLMEGGYDPVLNPDQLVEFKFRDNDLDVKIKAETHSIYKYEHNAITEDEMRNEIGKDPITDRGLMHQSLITQANVAQAASVAPKAVGSTATPTPGTKATNNKQKPTNQHGTKTSPKKVTNSANALYQGMVKDNISSLRSRVNDYANSCIASKDSINHIKISSILDNSGLHLFEVIDQTLDELYDKHAIKVQTLRAYDQLKTDLQDGLAPMQDYTEVIGLVDVMLDLTEQRLLQII